MFTRQPQTETLSRTPWASLPNRFNFARIVGFRVREYLRDNETDALLRDVRARNDKNSGGVRASIRDILAAGDTRDTSHSNTRGILTSLATFEGDAIGRQIPVGEIDGRKITSLSVDRHTSTDIAAPQQGVSDTLSVYVGTEGLEGEGSSVLWNVNWGSAASDSSTVNAYRYSPGETNPLPLYDGDASTPQQPQELLEPAKLEIMSYLGACGRKLVWAQQSA